MKIRAEFDSVDEAEAAAAALRKALPPMTSISISGKSNTDSHENDVGIFANFGSINAAYMYTAPIFVTDSTDSRKDYRHNSTVLSLTCHSDEYKTASRIIVGYGGRNIAY